MRKRDRKGWPEEKRARCGCGWELGGELNARAGAWKLARAERDRSGKRLFRLGSRGVARAKGVKSSVHGAARRTPGQLLGALLERIDFDSSPKGGLFYMNVLPH